MAPFNMRTSASRQEFLDDMGMIFLEESNILLWQNVNDSKLAAPALIKDIFPKENHLILSPKEDFFPSFRKDQDIYFKAKYKEMLFKTSPQKHRFETQEVKLPFPQKIFYQEQRSYPRFAPLSSQNIFLEMELAEHKQIQSSFYRRLRDISHQGIGLNVKFQEKHIFEDSNLFKIKSIDGAPLSPPITAEVIFNCPIKISKNKDVSFYVGLFLQSPLPQEILSLYSNK